jgi:predicted transposase YbfD/YdcC
VLGEVAVADQTDALGALAPLLAHPSLAGETLTFDARFTQPAVATDVVARGGASLMVVKANQPPLWRARAEATAAHPPRPRRRLGEVHTTYLAHGRVEQRTLLAVAAPPDLGLSHARQVLRLHRRRVSKRTVAVLTEETAHAVTSLSPEQAAPRQVLTLWRRHWRVENQVYRVRDVVFGEDASTTYTGPAPQAAAALRNLALSLLRAWHRPDITAARQYYASHPAAHFLQLGLRRP